MMGLVVLLFVLEYIALLLCKVHQMDLFAHSNQVRSGGYPVLVVRQFGREIVTSSGLLGHQSFRTLIIN